MMAAAGRVLAGVLTLVGLLWPVVATVPWMFFAPMAGVRRRDFYEAPAGQETPPTVSF